MVTVTSQPEAGTVERNSDLELCRILLMLAIIAHHYVANSGLMELIESVTCSGNTIFLLLFGAWGKTGINCFLLITGYFMCKLQITLTKFMKLLLEVEFYQFVFLILFVVAGYIPLSLKAVIKGLLPISSVGSNFVGCFLLFFLFIPFLNILIRHMSKREHQLLLLLFVYTILPSMRIPVSVNYITWFSVLYFISSYIRCYPNRWFENTKFWGVISIAVLLLSTSTIVGKCLFSKPGWGCYFFLSDSNKILAVLTSISLFLFFKNYHLRYSLFINTAPNQFLGFY